MSRESLSPARLEAFSDGVIAVIITVLVLELKVPLQDGLPGLRAVGPTVFLYMLTFVQVGIYWVNHHYLIDEAKSVAHGILWTNLAFLFCLSLFPFVTEWIGAKGLTHFSTALYAAVSLTPGLTYFLLAKQVRRLSEAPAHFSTAKQVTSLLLYLVAVPAAYVSCPLSLAMICVVSVVWILPPRGDAACDEAREALHRAQKHHPESARPGHKG